mgnify:CR=1 FL=1
MTDADEVAAAIAALRGRIDALDERILALLNERARLAAEIGDQKRRVRPEGPLHAPAREREVLARLEAANPGPFPAPAVRAVFQEVMSACLALEQPLRVAFLGPEGTFTHQAVTRQFGLSALALPLGTIGAIFDAVERGRADYGVVPVENASEGSVDPTLDAFLGRQVRIVGEILLPVEHALLLHPRLELAAVERVYSHPQALGQCRRWLEAHLPRAQTVEAPSTAEAARLAREDAAGAAIAAELAARLYDLRVGAERIQDLGGNATRFWVLGREPVPPSGHDRTTLIAVVRDRPGALLELLQPIARRGLSLSRIQSRPTRRRLWEYAFFLDLEGHESDPAVAAALEDLRATLVEVQVLGSYPHVEDAPH